MTKRVNKVTGAEYLRGNVVPISQPNVTQATPEISDWLEPLAGFLLWKKANGISESTLKDYERFTRQFFKRFPDCWGKAKDLKRAAMEFLSDEMKPATYNLRLIYLRAFFQWCVNEEYASSNPFEGYKRRKAQPRIVNIS
jgi:site-specific recombinase XerD